MRLVIVLLLAACGGDSSQGRVVHTPAPADTVGSPDAHGETASLDARGETTASLDARGETAASLDAPGVTIDAATRECFCFSWVHLDENGESCFETKPKCDTEFKAFGRTDKIPCSAAQRVACGSYACRNLGKECFRL